MELIFTLQQLPDAARDLIKAMGDNRLFAFNGDTGAVARPRSLLRYAVSLGLPTTRKPLRFSIVNEYLASATANRYIILTSTADIRRRLLTSVRRIISIPDISA